MLIEQTFTDRERFCLRAYRKLFGIHGNFFRAATVLFRITGHMEAILLTFLCSHADYVNRHSSNIPMSEEFYCRVSTIEKKIAMPERMQQRYLKRLVEMGFIAIGKDHKARRQIQINLQRLLEAVDALK